MMKYLFLIDVITEPGALFVYLPFLSQKTLLDFLCYDDESSLEGTP